MRPLPAWWGPQTCPTSQVTACVSSLPVLALPEPSLSSADQSARVDCRPGSLGPACFHSVRVTETSHFIPKATLTTFAGGFR